MLSAEKSPALDDSTPPWLSLERVGARLLNDPRDLPFLRLMLECAVFAAAGIGLYFAGPLLWYLVPVYWLVWILRVLPPFILMLHCTSHRALFRREHRWLNRIIPWVLGPFFGETPESYFIHHLGMHHREQNLPADTSSTLRFQRDSLVDWLRYVGRFLLLGLVDLGRYHRERGNRKLVRRLVVCELGFWAALGALAFIDWRATLVVFVVPVVVARTLMMTGNWGQHAFVCQDQPENPYRNSITCINTRYNARCFNDGYHIHHHVKARCHWTEYPEEFEVRKAAYGQQDAIVFDGIDFFMVWLLLMLGRWRRLARAFVRLPGAPERTEEEVIAFLKGRVAAFPRERLALLACPEPSSRMAALPS